MYVLPAKALGPETATSSFTSNTCPTQFMEARPHLVMRWAVYKKCTLIYQSLVCNGISLLELFQMCENVSPHSVAGNFPHTDIIRDTELCL